MNGSCELITSDGVIKAEHNHGLVSSKTSDGDIYLNDVQGENSARISDGEIVFDAMNGSLMARRDGNISGDLNLLSNCIYLKTSDSDINVTVPNGIGLDLILKGADINTM